jgi:hypothetical protein
MNRRPSIIPIQADRISNYSGQISWTKQHIKETAMYILFTIAVKNRPSFPMVILIKLNLYKNKNAISKPMASVLLPYSCCS